MMTTTISEQVAKSMVQEKFERSTLTKFLLVTKKYAKAIIELRNIRDEYGNHYTVPLKLTNSTTARYVFNHIDNDMLNRAIHECKLL